MHIRGLAAGRWYGRIVPQGESVGKDGEGSLWVAFGGWGHQPQGMGVLHRVATMEAH